MRVNGRKTGAAAPSRSCVLASALSAAALAGGLADPAEAMTIKATYDASITSRADSAQIQSAFNTAASFYSTQFANPATVNIAVSWGMLKGQAMKSGLMGATLDNMYGYYNLNQIEPYLVTAASSNAANTALKSAISHLPANVSGVTQFAIPYAEAKAMGLVSPTQPGKDSYIGFNSTAVWDYDPSDGIAANAYDFQAVAAHEIAHALGRVSGLQSSSPTYRTALDLFRYSAPGQLSFGYNTAAYFSLDGGVTRLGDFNYLTSGMDRDAWLSATTGIGDVQQPTAKAGKRYSVTARDLTILDVLGWSGLNAGNTNLANGSFAVRTFMGGDLDAIAGVPEPASWALLISGIGLIGMQTRRRRRMAPAAV
jgi:hypothetical protein